MSGTSLAYAAIYRRFRGLSDGFRGFREMFEWCEREGIRPEADWLLRIAWLLP